MNTRRVLVTCLAILLVFSLFAACGNNDDASRSGGAENSSTQVGGSSDVRVVLIVNRNFGDKGPIDSQARGLEVVSAMGLETKSLESLSPDIFEEDIRAMAKAGYDLIITSFPMVSEAAVAVAKDYPEKSFVGIYEFVNAGDSKIQNFWSVEYRLQELMYVVGAYHAKMTTSKKVGIITGEETISSYSEVNGFVDGVIETDPNCTVEVAFANSYGDPAKGKEIALAMISRGIDSICLLAGATSMGAIDACEENGIHCTGDNGDFSDRGPATLTTSANADFGLAVQLSAIDYMQGTFRGGEHTTMSLFEDGVYVDWDEALRFIERNPDKAGPVTAAMEYARSIETMIKSGELKVAYRGERPQ